MQSTASLGKEMRNIKIAMANGTACEPTMDDVYLIKHTKKNRQEAEVFMLE